MYGTNSHINYLQTLHCNSHFGTQPSLNGPPIVQLKNSLATDSEHLEENRRRDRVDRKKNTAKNATRILIMFHYAQ